MAEEGKRELQEAWKQGRICLHPTDTLPGLSFNPNSPDAWRNLLAIKRRAAEKTSIALVSDLAVAEKIWTPLPGSWPHILRGLWPGPLSVIWQAGKSCPASLRSGDGTVALRFPLLVDSWMHAALLDLNTAFPTTSVNHSGEDACQTWQEGLTWVKAHHPEIYVPSMPVGKKASVRTSKPSTLIRIIDGQRWEVLREGDMPVSMIEAEVSRYDGSL